MASLIRYKAITPMIKEFIVVKIANFNCKVDVQAKSIEKLKIWNDHGDTNEL
ncbi:unnamed protein product [Paramecium octaurelia]|uniref:Uncharacterized protein n=1 Tax=Paramecium octaurelia TaxID=43137 RepID=A0A8S1YCS3_PAROT|nr:unnamed protein product [Paramecium octaurelia]